MSCTEVKSNTYQTRKSPPFHAGDCKGQTKKGKNGMYVSKADKRGIYKWVKASAHGTRKGSSKVYLTHDNGTSAYRVIVSGNRVEIEKYSTNKPVKSYTAKHIYYGAGQNTSHTKGNSILLHLGGKKYVHIGVDVYEFEMEDEVDNYYSLIGNSDVPYPVLLGKEYVYFMLDHKYVPRSAFEIAMTPKMWEDAYAYYYGWLDPKTGMKHGDAERKSCGCALEHIAKKMKRFHMINRRTA
jgi:hypothetical protein